VLLRLLSEGEPYGYEQVTRVHGLGFDDVPDGSIYPALTRLEREGHLESRLVPSSSGPARKYYRLSASGAAALARGEQAWHFVVARVEPLFHDASWRTGGRSNGMTGLKTELLIWRLDRLRRDVPYGRRRRIRGEIHANLGEATQLLGEQDAIQRLGDVDDIAAEDRAAAGRGELPFRPDSGVRAAIWATVALLALTFIRIPTFGTVDTFDAHTDQQQVGLGHPLPLALPRDIRTSTLLE
jgi:PadR family transcriptional regulator PadR